MQAAFQQDAQPLQMAALSGQEMKETQGAWNPFVAVFAFFAVNYYWGQTTNSAQDVTASNTINSIGRVGCVFSMGTCVAYAFKQR